MYWHALAVLDTSRDYVIGIWIDKQCETIIELQSKAYGDWKETNLQMTVISD